MKNDGMLHPWSGYNQTVLCKAVNLSVYYIRGIAFFEEDQFPQIMDMGDNIFALFNDCVAESNILAAKRVGSCGHKVHLFLSMP